jgi:hypothetical protein
MGAAQSAMGGGEAPPHDPQEAEAAINAEADKAGAAGNSDLMAKLKAIWPQRFASARGCKLIFPRRRPRTRRSRARLWT